MTGLHALKAARFLTEKALADWRRHNDDSVDCCDCCDCSVCWPIRQALAKLADAITEIERSAP